MTTNLTPELKEAVFAKADAYINSSEHEGTEYGAYLNGANEYALKWQEAEAKAERYEKALKFIQAWQFPPTGQFWDNDKMQPMSYAACYGSNGERDFMRNVATEALTPKQSNHDTDNE